MAKTGKVELSNFKVMKIAAWYNRDFKANERNKALPMGLRLSLERNIQALIDNAMSFERICKEMWEDIRKEFSTDEKSEEVKVMQKDESGEEKEVTNRAIKEEYLEDYKEKSAEMSKKIEELSKETEVYSIRVFDLDAFADSLSDDTALSLDDLYMLTFMDENGDDIVRD